MPTPNYANGLIYKLVHKEDYDNANIYIGSTTNFRGRKGGHKTSCNNENGKNYKNPKYQIIRENGEWDAWEMIQVEAFPCTTKKELETRERYWIELMKPNLNRTIPTRSGKEYKIYNADKIKQYRQENADKIAERDKQYYQKNADKIKERAKQYYQDNADKIAEKNKQYYQDNADKIKERTIQYYQDNADKISVKVICEYCSCEVTKYNLKKHQKSAKCIKAKEALETIV
jgi:hypothetical protein